MEYVWHSKYGKLKPLIQWTSQKKTENCGNQYENKLPEKITFQKNLKSVKFFINFSHLLNPSFMIANIMNWI